jgi:hypothetical protein
MGSLLAVDTGLKTGLALYGTDGRLQWYRSRHLGSPAGLKRIAHALLNETKDLSWIVLEGGGRFAEIWEREAGKRGIKVLYVCAEEWRKKLFHPKQHRTGKGAKISADGLARKVIIWSGAAKPTSLRHDAAESILIGLWGALKTGLLESLPDEIRK